MGMRDLARRMADALTLAQARRDVLAPAPATYGRALRARRAAGFTFDGSYRPVDQVLSEMWEGSGRVSRDEALAVPGVLRARNIIAQPATWPLVDLDTSNRRHRNPLLEQTDPNVTNVVTWAQVLEDLLFEGMSWMRVLEVNSRNYPTKMEHLAFNRVTVQPLVDADGRSPLPSTSVPRERGQLAQIFVDGEPADHRYIKRFDSPNPGVLLVAGATIKTASTYRKTSQKYADNPRMDGYLYPKDGADPWDEDDGDDPVQDLLDEWEAARREHTTGYIPAALGYEKVDALSPADLQLMQLQDQATKDVALALGLEPEDLGLSTTSRTYANIVDKRIDRINDLLAAYVLAVTQRLSMGDITPAGHQVYADPNTYLRANPEQRVAYYEGMQRLGVFDSGDVADAEKVPRKPISTAAPAAGSNVVQLRPPTGQPSRMAAGGEPSHTFSAAGFDGGDLVVFDASSDVQRRTIAGTALPYGPTAIGRKNGRRFRFQQGSIVWPDPRHVPILLDHVLSASVGHYVAIDDRPDGTHVVARISSGPMGDQALAWASPEESVRTGFSVGVDFDESQCVPDPLNPGVLLVPVGLAEGKEISLVSVPSFQGARVATVIMSADLGGTTMPCSRCGHTHAPNAACTPQTFTADPQQPQQPQQPQPGAPAPTGPQQPQPGAPAPTGPQQPQPGAPAQQTFSVTPDQLGQVMAQFMHNVPAVAQQGAGPMFVDPVSRPVQHNVGAGAPQAAATQVQESPPYRFDDEGNLTAGPEYDFSSDLVKGIRDRDQGAYARALGFMREMTVGRAYGMRRRYNFDIDRADVAGLNPTRQRPDLYVDQKDYRYPLLERTRRGTLQDVTAFTLPKFNASSGLVGTHTEGVEPTSGTVTVTTQTITPTAKSGAIDMTREAWDQGGTPQASSIIWRQFTRAWYEGLEQGVATFLNTLTAATDITLTAGATDKALAKAWRAAIARLLFVRGGDRFDMMAAEQELFVALAVAETDAGEPIYPMLSPSNRNGSAGPRFSRLNADGVDITPAWALASTAGSPNNSWLFDSETVHTWDTGPQRLEFAGIDASGNYAPVAMVRLAVWGYQALANTDISGVRQVIYDTTA